MINFTVSRVFKVKLIALRLAAMRKIGTDTLSCRVMPHAQLTVKVSIDARVSNCEMNEFTVSHPFLKIP